MDEEVIETLDPGIDEETGTIMNEHRKFLYSYLKDNAPSYMTNSDLNVFIELIALVFGDLFQITHEIPSEVDIDACDIDNLKHLASLVKYPWNDALTYEQQRETIKFWMLIRRNRGTKFSYINLIRLFGKDATTYYSNADHTGVRVIEYGIDYFPEDYDNGDVPYKMFPGDIRIEVPELSTILRDALKDIQLMGTRIIFAFVLYLGAYNEQMTPNFWHRIKQFIRTDLLHGWNPMIMYYGPDNEETLVRKVYDWQLVLPSRSGEMFASVSVRPKYVTPRTHGFFFAPKGLERYAGHIFEDGILNEDDILYR